MGRTKKVRRPSRQDRVVKPIKVPTAKTKKQRRAKKPAQAVKNTIRDYTQLKITNARLRQLSAHTTLNYSTVVDNGAEQCLIGRDDWTVINSHPGYVKVVGALGSNNSEILQLVDAHTTLLNEEGNPIAIF